jgi:hypothetical protein
LVAANGNKYANVLCLPEYNGNEVYADVLDWVTDNFGGQSGIPICLNVFEGGPYSDHVVCQYANEQIQAFMAVANIKWVRIFEVISWYIAHEQEFPTTYVANLLDFCAANNLKVIWTEYKVDHVFQDIQTYISGHESIVYVGFATNSGEYEPYQGWKHVKDLGFTHCAASVQSWYWETRHRASEYSAINDPQNMPAAWMVQHACLARDMEVEAIEFEPYWYFFGYTDGVARASLTTISAYLNNYATTAMDANSVILQTIYAEWLYGPTKTQIKWLDGCVESAWKASPFTFNFLKISEPYAIHSFNLGSTTPTEKYWLKRENVAIGILTKTIGKDLDSCANTREAMRQEVERIIHMYSQVGPLWEEGYTYADGSPKRRRIPGMNDVVIISEPYAIDNRGFARITIQIRCKISQSLYVTK